MPVPPIIDKALFDAAQLKLQQRKILSDRNKLREYLCGGLMHCAECGSKMSGECSHGRQKYYICYNRKKRIREKRCTMPWLRSDRVDRVVWAKIESVLKNPKVLQDAIAFSGTAQDASAVIDEDKLRSQLREKDNEESRMLRLYSKGKISEASLDSILREIRQEREHIERQIMHIRSQEEMRQRVQRTAVSLKQIASKIDSIPFAERREILRTFVDGTPGTGIFVEGDGLVKIVGTVPVPENPALPGSVQNSSML